jgi:hypothetical protein
LRETSGFLWHCFLYKQAWGGNERFVQNAKAEVELEKRNRLMLKARIKTIEESLDNL